MYRSNLPRQRTLSRSHRRVQTERLGKQLNPAFLFGTIRESTFFLSAPVVVNAYLCDNPAATRISVCSRPSRPMAGDKRAKGYLLPTRETEWTARENDTV